MTIEEYIERIDGFLSLKPSEQISYFGYFLVVFQNRPSFGAKDIEDCFVQLHLPSYSNISAFLSKEKLAKRVLKNKNGGYTLSAHNRRFNATKSDIDAIKSGLRIIVEDLVHLIDHKQ